jgi:hypothetical protein
MPAKVKISLDAAERTEGRMAIPTGLSAALQRSIPVVGFAVRGVAAEPESGGSSR